MTIRFGILTLSDRSSRGERADASGPALALLIEAEVLPVSHEPTHPQQADHHRHDDCRGSEDPGAVDTAGFDPFGSEEGRYR